MISTLNELTEGIYNQIGQASSLVTAEYDDDEGEYVTAANTALSELSLSLPLDNAKLEYWLLSRGKRHILDIVRTSSATKFRYKQIHLNQRFDHFNTLIKEMDESFAYALITDAELMGLTGDNVYTYITYIRPGYVYSSIGEDLTYEEEA